MKNKNFIKAFSEIYPQKNKKDEILENILEGINKKSISNNTNYKLILSFAALIVLIISFPKKDVFIEPNNLSRANLFAIEESPSFVYKDNSYIKSENSFSISKDESINSNYSTNQNKELSPFPESSLSEKDFLGEYLFTIEDSSNLLFGAKVYKSTKDKEKLIVLFNNVYEEYEIIRNR